MFPLSIDSLHLFQKRSTCSQHATDRGPEQKVISYSFYGPLTSAYFNGIFENLAGVRMYYPDYVMRLYLDRRKASSADQENYQKLCQLFCREPNFDLCDVNEIGTAPRRIWIMNYFDFCLWHPILCFKAKRILLSTKYI